MFEPVPAHTHKPVSWRRVSLSALSLAALAFGSAIAGAQVSSFGGNAQHTNLYTGPAQNTNHVRWQTYIDTTNPGFLGHYGAPVITANNTVITPVVISSTGVQVSAFDGATGAPKYTLATDFIFAPHGWLPEYQPCLSGNRLYYAGAGGTVYYVDNADTNTPSAPTQLCFYGLANYQGNTSGFNNTVFQDTPITADSAGNIYFGFRVANGTAPAPLNTGESGYVKITAAGAATYVLVDAMTSDATITRDCHNTAPALSNDESKLYVVAGQPNTRYYGYLVALNTSDMSTSSKVFLLDPRNGQPAGLLDDGTASPMVAPDGDVFLGVFGNPYNGSRGFLAHYSGDLSVTKPYGGFGWDYTPAIVPASMIPSYNGSSSYLLFCKYNNYTGTGVDDGDGVNRVAVLDPNALQTDIHASSSGLQIMREVQTVIGFTPDSENPDVPNAVREMCVNASAVNPTTDSVFFNSEDGNSYRWNLASNQVTQALTLTSGFGEPYVPTVIGPDGTVYTLNGGILFAMGGYDDKSISMTSSAADSRTDVLGSPITFTATVSSGSGTPTGTVTFSDFTYNGPTPVTTPLGVATLDGSGHASVSTSALTAGLTYLGNHFITASYSGDGNFTAGVTMLVQKVHGFASSTALQATGNPSPYGQPVLLTATVTPVLGTDVPTGQVTFLNDNKVIGQVPVNGSGTCSFTATGLKAGVRDLQAYYQSDTEYASSANIQEVTITDGTTTSVGSSPNPSTFGQNVTFTATVSPADAGAGTPTGSVIFTIDGSAGSPVTVNGSGQATFSTSALTTGSHTVSAAFTGTNGWGNSSGNGSNQSVTDGTTTGVGSSPNPSNFNQSVTFTATVSAVGTGAGTPTGSVVFTIDGSAGSPVTVDGTGHATFSTSSLTVGSHTVSAAFTGTGGFGNSSGSGTNQSVTATTSTTVSGAPNPSNVGASVTFTATVTSAGGTPTGNVTFKDGATTLGSSAVNGTGHATFSTSSLTVGSHSITANFVGTGGYQNSSGGTTQVVQNVPGPTTTTVTSNLNPSIQGQNVTFTATVVKTSGGGIPAGSVAFKNGNTTIATVTLDGTGHAATSISTLSVGNHNMKAIFTGTGGWGNSTSAILVQTVLADTTPPSIPQNVHATAGPGSGKITISWDASTDPDDAVANYQVFRAKTLNGSYSRVATVTTLSYLDNPGSNLTRFYYVIAVDSHGNKSAPSAKVSATAPAVIKAH